MAKELWKGNEAVAEAAIRAGCRFFFGYPITPQNEIPEYFSRHLPEHGGCFLQAESEIAAINMTYGAAGSGVRVMTSSSSPGISLKQEGITYIAGAELPVVIVNMMRGGPGLGNIAPSQSDYFQATRGGGNGDYRTVVLAPSTIQEAADLTQEAFDIADVYRIPVLVLADGLIGQMMEAIEWRSPKPRSLPPKDWATDGSRGKRGHNVVNSLYIETEDCTALNRKLQQKHELITKNEIRYEEFMTRDAEVLFVSYGTTARVAHAAVLKLRKDGVKAGLFRPITLWPFPEAALRACAQQTNVKAVVTAEMSMGQMLDDVKIAVNGAKPVRFVGTGGGTIPTPAELMDEAQKAIEEVWNHGRRIPALQRAN
ncbi:MAG: 3-methyl-2-oxobutanoate dehydrogenase subunit VorB [Clostridiales bacterium]|nr:3-methyl-2-oxobutanoate dehydrogenase subunit VorB [Clostridiales bacterium]